MKAELRSCRAWLLALVFVLLAGSGTAAELLLLLLPAPSAIPAEPAAGMPVRFEVYGLNRETMPLPAAFPETLACRITVKGSAQILTARLAAPAAADAMVPPGSFVRREYELPAGIMPAGPFQIELLSPQIPVPAAASRPKPDNRLNQMEEGIFRNFSPYETNYCVAGSEDPVIRFQLSFKFSILGECAGAAVTDWLGRPYVAYSQISLWDWMERSSPFYDTSYKPELFMLKKDMPLRLPLVRSWDLQYGIQHESNGKGGDQSRSQNLAYIKPVFHFGNPDKFHLSLTPRFYQYIGDMSDNRDMHDYRGYGDLTAKLGWNDGLILSGMFRTGYEFIHNTVQLELSYPMYRLPGCSQISDNLFIFFQVFNGYGESLLDYNRPTTGIRAGFAISR